MSGVLVYLTKDGETVAVEGAKDVIMDGCHVEATRCNITSYSCAINASGTWVGPLEIEGTPQESNAFLMSDKDEVHSEDRRTRRSVPVRVLRAIRGV